MRKNFTHHFPFALLLAALVSLSTSTAALAQTLDLTSGWQINLPTSSLTFNTTKSGAAGVGGATETMRFKSFKGGMDNQGRIQLDIDLSSIDSGIEIRDERMKTMLWNVATQPEVVFSTQIKPDELQKIKAGKEPVLITVDGQLRMAGQSKPIQAQLQVASVNKKLLVSTRRAIVINANDFGLTAGVEALRAIMGLNYLSTSAPVTFQLELSPVATKTTAALPASAW